MNTLTYTTVTTLGDFGPWISKLILNLPSPARSEHVFASLFNVHTARFEHDGAVLMRAERGKDARPSRGYLTVRAAYPCDEKGRPADMGTRIALELPETRLTKRIEGSVTGSRYISHAFIVTLLANLPVEVDETSGGAPLTGLTWSEAAVDLCPELERWHVGTISREDDDIRLSYGYFEPDFEPAPVFPGPFAKPAPKPEKAALIVYLHGAGEGVGDATWEGPERAYTGNRVTALSGQPIQDYFGGAAWVLVPQCPTFWMDDGVEQLGRSNRSIYTEPLKALIDEFVEAHADRIDTDRIIVAGLSNGGFMTVRMCLDYPDFFAAGLPCCAPFFEENQTDDAIETLARTPLWFVHTKGDELVDPRETALPLYHKLAQQPGAEVHFTYFDHVEDLTGRYRETDGSPKKTFNHGVWIHQFNDFCRTDLDGTNVLVNGEPVSCWEWAAHMRR